MTHPLMTITVPLDHHRVQSDDPVGESLEEPLRIVTDWVRDNIQIAPGHCEWIREDFYISTRIGDITVTLHQVDDNDPSGGVPV